MGQPAQAAGQRQLPHPRLTWSCPTRTTPGSCRPSPGARIFFKSCRDGNLKRLDLGTYFALKSAISKQLYRFLDKRFYLRPDWTYDLRELAFEHVGMSRNYAPWKIKQKLQPALEELEAIGFLEPMSAADRYSKTGRGAWNIRLVRKLPPPAEAKPAETKPPEPEPTGLEKELVERGVTRSVAADLVRDFPADRIRHQIEVVDWLRETKPKRVKDLGAYLAEAIRKDFAAAGRFPEPGRACRGGGDRAGAAGPAGAGPPGEGPRRRSGTGSGRTGRRLPAERRAALDAEALAEADPADRTAYETATAPPVKKMLQAGLRDAHLRRLLGLPAAD